MSDESTFTCGTCDMTQPVEYETRFQGEPICRACWKAHQVRSLTATRDLLYATRDLIRPAVDDSMPAEESREHAEVRAREMLANEAEVCAYQLYRLQGKDLATERIRDAMMKAKGANRQHAGAAMGITKASMKKARGILRSVLADRGDHRPIDWALAVLALAGTQEIEESK